ncbi:MAG: 50S ribosomal protein L24 [Candidatus Pacebacteria bacterium]|nr:50S ribosomal protein L24 [Candidatus Paceibacterota bacterium]
MKIKVGDIVTIISGSRKDKNKRAKVLKTFSQDSQIIVEGVNIKKKVVQDPQGKKNMVNVEYPIHVSNAMFFDDKSGKGTKIGYTHKEGKKVRINKKSGTELK